MQNPTHATSRVAVAAGRTTTSAFSNLLSFSFSSLILVGLLSFGSGGGIGIQGVAAHGYVQEVSITGGQWYPGFDDSKWNDRPSSAIMITDYLEPNYDVNSREIACGKNAKPAQQIATVSPGNQISWRWVTHSGAGYKSWTHNEGTHRSWIASCNGDCSTTDPTTVQWVELTSQYTGQQGYDGTYWPVRTLASGQPWTDTIPPAPNGDYLIRNELTALHYSTQPVGTPPQDGHDWGCEFYPTCMAIRIQNSDGSYDMSQAVSFPGAYNVNVAGHYNPKLWTDPNSVGIAATNKYPRTAGTTSTNNGNNGNSNSNNSNGNNNNNNTPAPAPTSTSPAPVVIAVGASAPSPSSSSRPNPICTKRKSKRSERAAGAAGAAALKRRSNTHPHQRRKAY
ncbi:hypothetical protein FRC19_000873 [Serendipita sp. 401]|nr:hypothetical protein FRC19_000873 [Serendipita sp. 401]KAG9047243.1 hypothetical protein FS842_000697 [Serendipita sp. 407]